MDGIAKNTDKEIWRERLEDFYSDSIHVTADGRIGINSGGHVIVMPIRSWYEAARKAMPEILIEKEREIIRHTLGLDHSKSAYRNHYVATEGHLAYDVLESLVKRGFMVKTEHDWTGEDRIYCCTEKARELVAAVYQ